MTTNEQYARRVMGWEWTDRPDDNTAKKVIQCWVKDGKCLVSSPYTSKYRPQPDPTPYSHQWREFALDTNPADAWAVLQKCAEKCAEAYNIYRPTCSLVIYVPTDDLHNQWIVADSEEMSVSGEGPTLQAAICNFALKLFPETERTL